MITLAKSHDLKRPGPPETKLRPTLVRLITCLLSVIGALSFGITPASADLFGVDRFNYSDGPIQDLSGGRFFDWDNVAKSHTGTSSDWDVSFGTANVSGGKLISTRLVDREYNGPTEGASFSTDEGIGAVRANFANPGVLYYRIEMTRSSAFGWSGISSLDFETETIFFGISDFTSPVSGLREFGIDVTSVDAANNGRTFSGIAPVVGQTYVMVCKMDFDNDLLSLWLDPDIAAGENANAPLVTRPYTGVKWSTSMRLTSQDPTTWDDLAVANTWEELNLDDMSLTVGGQPVVDGGSIDLGVRQIGSPVSVQVTIVNSGTGGNALTGLAITKAGSNPGDFTVSAPGSTTVASGGSTTFTVTFNPSAVDARSATLEIASSLTGSKNPYNLTLSGTGSAVPVPDITVTESGVTVVDGGSSNFGTRPLNSPLTRTFVINNTGNATLSGLSISKTGDGDFTNGALGTTSLAPGQTTSFTVTFSATQGGARSGALTVSSNVAGSKNPYNINVEGFGAVAPLLTVNRARRFPATVVRKSSRPQNVRISNIGDGALTGLRFITSGKDRRDFRIQLPSVRDLSPGASTFLRVTFKPKKPGSRIAKVTVLTTNAGTKQIALSGKGKGPKKK